MHERRNVGTEGHSNSNTACVGIVLGVRYNLLFLPGKGINKGGKGKKREGVHTIHYSYSSA
jgi:hypothetical protein